MYEQCKRLRIIILHLPIDLLWKTTLTLFQNPFCNFLELCSQRTQICVLLLLAMFSYSHVDQSTVFHRYKLGVEFNSITHHFASRLLIDTLAKLGFCSSYREVQNFESCAAFEKGKDIPTIGADLQGFLQYVADNIDHNT